MRRALTVFFACLFSVLAWGQVQPPITNFPINTTRFQTGQITVTDQNVGMVGDGVTDNSTKISTLNGANAGPFGGYDVVFPADTTKTSTVYYFSTQLDVARAGHWKCTSTGGNTGSVVLVFAPGMDGVVFHNNITNPFGQNTYGTGDLEGCSIYSLGFGTGVLTDGATTVTGAFTQTVAGVPATGWAAGDGIIGMAWNGQTGPNFTNGAYIDSVSGALGNQTLTLHAGHSVVMTHTWSGGITNGSNQVNAGTCNNVGKACWSTNTVQVGGSITGANIPNGTTVTAVNQSTQTITMSANATATAQENITWHDSQSSAATLQTGSQLHRLPAALALNVNTTTGSNTVTVTSGSVMLHSGDEIWSDAFPVGSVIQTVSGSVGAQTLAIADPSGQFAVNATVTHTSGSGKLWRLPAGIRRYQQAGAKRNYIAGFVYGLSMVCITAGQGNCTTSYDERNQYFNNLVGRLAGGDNTGASVSIQEETALNNWHGVVEDGTLGTTYVGLNTNDGSGNTQAPIVGNCISQNNSAFFGGYDDVAWGSFNYCHLGNNGGQGPTRYGQMGDTGFAADVPFMFSYGAQIGKWSFSIGGTSPGVCFYPFYNTGGVEASTHIMRMAAGGCSDDFGSFDWVYDPTNDLWYLNSANSGSIVNQMLTSVGWTGYKQPGYLRDIGFPHGFLFGGIDDPIANVRFYDAGSISPSNAGSGIFGTHGRGDVRFNLTPSAGGTMGWVFTSAGSTSKQFGPISVDDNGTQFAATYWQTTPTTVGALITCNAGNEGARAYVTDQNTAVAYRGAVTGGGTTRQAVLCSNNAWIQD